jgi:transposase
MMISLTAEEKQALRIRHRVERDRRIAERIKAVVLHLDGWSNIQIAAALLIHVDTVSEHLSEYAKTQKLKPENSGSLSQLNASETKELIEHLEAKTFMKVADICAYVTERYDTVYTVSGMTQWLHRHKFSFKQTKGTPAKADLKKQGVFIAYYEDLLSTTPEDEPVLFGDGVHPTMATKVSCGWIRRGTDKLIATTASRTRINLFGTLDLSRMEVQATAHETLDSVAIGKHFESLRHRYPKAPKIHVILDQGSYNKSQETRDAAKRYGIELHFLPPYSPNLNPIERVWKIMNEHVRNNVYFESASQFRTHIHGFFSNTWPSIAQSHAV